MLIEFIMWLRSVSSCSWLACWESPWKDRCTDGVQSLIPVLSLEEKREQLFDSFLLPLSFNSVQAIFDFGPSWFFTCVCSGRVFKKVLFSSPPLFLGNQWQSSALCGPSPSTQASAAKSSSHRKWQVHKVGFFSHQPNPRLV